MSTKSFYFRNFSVAGTAAGSQTIAEGIGTAVEDTTSTHTGNGTNGFSQVIKPGATQGNVGAATGLPETVAPPNAGDRFGWFTDRAYKGTFANTNWTFQHRHDDNGAFTGVPVFNVYASTTKDFTGTMRFLFQAQGANWWTNSTATASFTSTPGAVITLNNEYLFVSVWCDESASGTAASHKFHTEGTVDGQVSKIITSEFSQSFLNPTASNQLQQAINALSGL